MSSNIMTSLMCLFAGLAFASAIGAAKFGFHELYGFAGLAGCISAFIAFIQKH